MALGYPLELTQKALLITGDRASAIEWLMRHTSEAGCIDTADIMHIDSWVLLDTNGENEKRSGGDKPLLHPGTWSGSEWR